MDGSFSILSQTDGIDCPSNGKECGVLACFAIEIATNDVLRRLVVNKLA